MILLMFLVEVYRYIFAMYNNLAIWLVNRGLIVVWAINDMIIDLGNCKTSGTYGRLVSGWELLAFHES